MTTFRQCSIFLTEPFLNVSGYAFKIVLQSSGATKYGFRLLRGEKPPLLKEKAWKSGKRMYVETLNVYHNPNLKKKKKKV